jgi:hypothetical protein
MGIYLLFLVFEDPDPCLVSSFLASIRASVTEDKVQLINVDQFIIDSIRHISPRLCIWIS